MTLVDSLIGWPAIEGFLFLIHPFRWLLDLDVRGRVSLSCICQATHKKKTLFMSSCFLSTPLKYLHFNLLIKTNSLSLHEAYSIYKLGSFMYTATQFNQIKLLGLTSQLQKPFCPFPSKESRTSTKVFSKLFFTSTPMQG